MAGSQARAAPRRGRGLGFCDGRLFVQQGLQRRVVASREGFGAQNAKLSQRGLFSVDLKLALRQKSKRPTTEFGLLVEGRGVQTGLQIFAFARGQHKAFQILHGAPAILRRVLGVISKIRNRRESVGQGVKPSRIAGKGIDSALKQKLQDRGSLRAPDDIESRKNKRLLARRGVGEGKAAR